MNQGRPDPDRKLVRLMALVLMVTAFVVPWSRMPCCFILTREAWDGSLARTFYHHGFESVFPAMDIGILPMLYRHTAELPIFALIIGTLYHLTGVHESIARYLGCVSLAMGVLAMFLLARRLLQHTAGAFAAAFFFLFGSTIL